MILSSNLFTHQMIEDQVQINDMVLDATTGNGNNTRFLASRVGPAGKVFTYSPTKAMANDTAASLFLSGLNERVSVYQGQITNQQLRDLHQAHHQFSLALFDYSSDTEISDYLPSDLVSMVTKLLPYLKHGGLLIVKFNQIPAEWPHFLDTLWEDDYTQAIYQTQTVTTYLVNRI